MKILIVGHACCPHMGSEPGFTWNYSWTLAAEHEVFVIAHPQFRAKVDQFLEQHAPRRIQILWVDVPAAINPWKPGRGERWIRLHYLLWNRAACKAAKELLSKVPIDVAHHISWGTISAPPFLWKLSPPFVWGPVGGGQVAPPRFSKYFGSQWPMELARSTRVRGLPLLPSVRRVARSAARILATNNETAEVLHSAGARAVELRLDSGLTCDRIVDQVPLRDHQGLTLLWAGRLERRKALPLVLEALAQCRESPMRLLVAGEGPMRSQWEQLAASLGLQDRVQFVGHRSWPDLTNLFRTADAFIFSSLRDSFGSVVLEAMGHGLPIITLDHQGVGTFVPDNAGVKVPVTTPAETVQALVSAARDLLQAPHQLREKGREAWLFAREHTWDRRVQDMLALYREIVHESCPV